MNIMSITFANKSVVRFGKHRYKYCWLLLKVGIKFVIMNLGVDNFYWLKFSLAHRVNCIWNHIIVILLYMQCIHRTFLIIFCAFYIHHIMYSITPYQTSFIIICICLRACKASQTMLRKTAVTDLAMLIKDH